MSSWILISTERSLPVAPTSASFSWSVWLRSHRKGRWNLVSLVPINFSVCMLMYCVGLEVLTDEIVKSSVFSDITPCSPLKANLRFGGLCRLDLQGRRISHTKKSSMKQDASSRNVGWLSTDYTVISQNIELFTTTAVRTSDSARDGDISWFHSLYIYICRDNAI
jgi:hypothetical protein